MIQSLKHEIRLRHLTRNENPNNAGLQPYLPRKTEGMDPPKHPAAFRPRWKGVSAEPFEWGDGSEAKSSISGRSWGRTASKPPYFFRFELMSLSLSLRPDSSPYNLNWWSGVRIQALGRWPVWAFIWAQVKPDPFWAITRSSQNPTRLGLIMGLGFSKLSLSLSVSLSLYIYI